MATEVLDDGFAADPDDIVAALAAQYANGGQAPKPEEPKAEDVKPEESKATEEPKQEEKPAEQKAAKEEPPHHDERLVPLAVAQAARRKAREAEEARERERQEKDAEIAALKERLTALEARSAAQPDTPDVEDVTAEEMERIEYEQPAVAKALRAQTAYRAQIQKVEAELKALRESQEAERKRADEIAQRRVQEEVESAILSNPTLRYLEDARAENPTAQRAWDRIAIFDDDLRSDPQWQGKPLASRFAQALALYERAYGEVALPVDYQEPGDVGRKATETVAKVRAAAPTTLSDVKGGTPPPQSEIEAVEQIQPHELARKMERMNADELAEWLAKIG